MIEVVFEKERETKNTIRFKEVDAVINGVEVEANTDDEYGPVVGTLYIQKWALRECFPDGLPKQLVVSIGAL